MKVIIYLISVIFSAGFTLAVHGQAIEPSLYQGKIASNGSWITYTLSYGKIDTLFVENTDTNIRYSFPEASNESFSHEDKWMACTKSDSLYVFDLISAKKHIIPSITNYRFLTGKKLLSFGYGKMAIHELPRGKIYTFEGCLSFYPNKKETTIAIISGKETNEISLLDLSTKVPKRTMLLSVTNKISGLVWSQSSSAFAFFEKHNSGNLVHYFNLKNNNHKVFEISALKSISGNFSIPGSRLFISNDGNQVFFDTVETNNQNSNTNDPLVWTGEMRKLPLVPHPKPVPLWQMWLPDNDKLISVETPDYPLSILTAEEKYAVLMTQKVEDPSVIHESDKADLTLMNLETGNKKLLVKDAVYERDQILISREDKIVWFKDKNWYSYDFETEKSFCLTCNIPSIFYDTNNDRPGIAKACGMAGWFAQGSQAIVYDEFDIWLIAKGKLPIRITHGREKNTVYRVRNPKTDWEPNGKLNSMAGEIYAGKDLALLTKNLNTMESGIALWTPKGGLYEWPTSFHETYGIQKAKLGDRITYVRSSYNIPPQIVVSKHKSLKVIKTSKNGNEPQKVKIISYKGLRDENLKGALFYPTAYNPAIKYPMIVFIYERYSYMAHEYMPVKSSGKIGFNPAQYVRNGYFVLCPDINYQLNEIGKSALFSVNQAIEKTSSVANIDINRLGLIGHSFGGFETVAILTQCDRFKVAVSGAGVMDLTSHYLSVDNNGRERKKKFENGQQRLRFAFYQKGFQDNSPILSAYKIKTPLLLWTGDEDGVVNPDQSTSMFLALRRLGKTTVLLKYPKQDHVLSDAGAQEDLGLKIMQWFDYQLIGNPSPTWYD
ncbi:alpha/beta hydrolase family protein [Flavobacterium gelatinilyticum]|uniref:alpha/beta hydrolase family protein n=1 Tax=Flavobacterium gelatinilyticum TaxID=3003260 RepID=UPI00248010F4|nr:prolyl oligopeptidase family serine peptidase [Flavobacterium gelatinilyticum]